MIKRQYIVDYEVWKDGKAVEWGTQSWTTRGWFAENSGEMAREVDFVAAQRSGCEPSQVRIKGIFKL